VGFLGIGVVVEMLSCIFLLNDFFFVKWICRKFVSNVL